jgi:hypothetical protein
MRTIRSVVLMLIVAAPLPALAKMVRFLGPHPVAQKHGGGYCYIEAPHMHAYPPDHSKLYQQVNGQEVFTGDPTPFGYEGEKHMYYGHHPLPTSAGEPVYCFIDGPHVHPFAVPESPEFKVKGDVAFYVGAFPPAVVKMRRERAREVNIEYKPYVAFRPQVTVEPPPEWHADVVVGGPVIVAPPAPGVVVTSPGVVVNSPGVIIGAPPPVVVGGPGVVVGAPGVVVHSPGVVVGAPPPPRVRGGVVVGAPGVVVGGPPGVVVEGGVRREHWEGDRRERREHWEGDQGGREHHDNGKHKGWGKH